MIDAARIELMASAVGKIGGVTWHHLFLVAADAAGKQEYLRAGPQCLPAEMLFGRTGEHGDPLEDYEPPAVLPYGVITFSSGPYEPGSVDFDPVAANVSVASDRSAAPLWEKIQKTAQAMQEEKIPYDPVGKGANWALMEALRRCGVQPPLPPKRWAPGASHLIFDPPPPGGPTRRVGQASVVV